MQKIASCISLCQHLTIIRCSLRSKHNYNDSPYSTAKYAHPRMKINIKGYVYFFFPCLFFPHIYVINITPYLYSHFVFLSSNIWAILPHNCQVHACKFYAAILDQITAVLKSATWQQCSLHWIFHQKVRSIEEWQDKAKVVAAVWGT